MTGEGGGSNGRSEESGTNLGCLGKPKQSRCMGAGERKGQEKQTAPAVLPMSFPHFIAAAGRHYPRVGGWVRVDFMN